MSAPLSYGQLEGRLVAAFVAGTARLGAFRAQIRHFRRLGIPALPKVGSGARCRYDDRAIAELTTALKLREVGFDNEFILRFIVDMRRVTS